LNYDAFKKRCKEKGYSPSSLVVALGLSTSNITNWKNGGNPSYETLIKMSQILECSTEYLLQEKNDEFSEISHTMVNGGLEMKNDHVMGSDVAMKCPFCGKGKVYATVLTTFTYKKEYPMYVTGVEIEGDSIGEMIGECSEPVVKCSSYRCDSCEKRWFPFQYKIKKDENGNCTFIECEK